jgi:hypothetical protein
MKAFTATSLMILGCLIAGTAHAQPKDSVVINVGKESKVVIVIKDKNDLQTLKHYNFQALVDDMITKLEQRDSTPLTRSAAEYRKDTTSQPTASTENWGNLEESRNKDRNNDRPWRQRRTYHTVNFDVGMNNYVSNGQFPDASNQLYAVKPWGSWYVGINSTFHSRISNHVTLDWGGGVSWYNFKFSNEKVAMGKDGNGVIFSEDTRDASYRKSKLTAVYVNASLVPMITFGRNERSHNWLGNTRYNRFRFGVGPYVGYLVDSYSKQMFYANNDKQREHHHDNYYLNNVRYGIRAQFGFRDTDMFISYDLNNLFADNKGPELHAFAFGFNF